MELEDLGSGMGPLPSLLMSSCCVLTWKERRSEGGREGGREVWRERERLREREREIRTLIQS
jgi:hypothetical protein